MMGARNLPLLVILIALAGLSMLLPAAHASIMGEHAVARGFFYSGLVVVLLGAMVGIEVSTAALTHAEQMIFGALIVWFLIVEPHGLAKLWSVGKQKLRLWPFPH